VLDPIVTTLDGANEVTHEAGTATGDENESGITTVVGITTTDDDGNETIVEVTIETTTDDGTEFGTDDH